MHYVTPFGVSTSGLALFKNCYLNEDVVTDNTAATSKLINFLLCAISFASKLRQSCQMHQSFFFFTVANTACLKKKANEFQGKFPVTFSAYAVYRIYRSRLAAEASKVRNFLTLRPRIA